MKPRALILSAYDAQSHQYWHKGIVEHIHDYDFTVLTLPARNFSWRIRGNSLYWAHEHRKTLDQHYDFILATSMTDLSALRGFVPNLANIPCAVYFHENQFAYPNSATAYKSIEPQILNIYTAATADKVLFNSEYNRSTFFAGARALLKKMPDCCPVDVIDLIDDNSSVLPVPIKIADSPTTITKTNTDLPLHILWNHRWEYDKGPELLRDCMQMLLKEANERQEFDSKLSLVGQQFRQQPKEFEQIKTLLGDRLAHFGYMENPKEYADLLQTADIVLSTAHHDFQGIAILEAASLGCVPVLPKRLAYPELFPEERLYGNKQDKGLDQELESLTQHLLGLAKLKKQGQLPKPPNIEHLSWQQLKHEYRSVFTSLVTQSQ